MAGSPPPFSAERYDLGRVRVSAGGGESAVTVTPFPSAAASQLAEALAAIDPWKSYPYPASGLARYFASSAPTAPIYALCTGGTIAGVVGLRLDWLRGPYLQFLGILPEHQGLGLGARVLDWMQREAGPQTRNLWVCASDFNVGAIRFYERHGFRRIAVLDGLVQDDRTEVLLRKRLA